VVILIVSETTEKRSTGALAAGVFSKWLRHYMRVQAQPEQGADVPCGDCNACCRSSYFIHIRAEEHDTLEQIPSSHLARAGRPHEYDSIMNQNCGGRCPMLVDNRCSIYAHRPQTCRNYDCRAFAAAGIGLGSGPRAAINERVWQWRFEYPTDLDAQRHSAVQAAAAFLQRRADLLLPAHAPTDAGQLAKAAIAVHELFLETDAPPLHATASPADADLAAAISRRLKRLADERAA
jgi:hypothetical protein